MTETPDYAELQRQNAEKTAGQVAAVLAALALSQTDPYVAGPQLASVIVGGGARAIVLADIGMAALIASQINLSVLPVGLTMSRDHTEVITRSTETVLSSDDARTQIVQLAKMIPLDMGQDAAQDALTAQGVQSWTRHLDANPCPLCQSLAGGVVPISKHMIRHPHCACYPEPVVAADFRPVTGHGLGRMTHRQLAPGITTSQSAPILNAKGATL